MEISQKKDDSLMKNGCFKKIGIDARLYNASGIGRYLKNLIAGLQKIDKVNKYYIFLLGKDFDNLTFPENFQKVKADIPWYTFSEQLKFPRIIGKYSLDLMHFPHFNVPVFYNGKFIVTIHDLIHQHYQMKRATTHNFLFYRFKTIGYNLAYLKAIRKSQKIITPSNFVKEQLIKEWKVAEKKITVTYEGAEDKFIKLAAHKNPPFISREKNFLIQDQYLFYVGNAHPHKNLDRLIKVFDIISKQKPELKLVLSGPDSFFWQKLQKENKNPNVYFTGFITDEQLVSLYQNAQMFIMPSLEEGFGLPILEAMACSCPVISSNAGSLPEIGDKAAAYFDPKDENDMYQKIVKVLEDKKLQQELIRKGLERYKIFSWDKLAQQTLDIYASLI